MTDPLYTIAVLLAIGLVCVHVYILARWYSGRLKAARGRTTSRIEPEPVETLPSVAVRELTDPETERLQVRMDLLWIRIEEAERKRRIRENALQHYRENGKGGA